jgi:hypothetical protein
MKGGRNDHFEVSPSSSVSRIPPQAKKLARDIAAGAMARACVQLPNVDLPLSQRNAQLVLAREYGFAGWQHLTAEVSKRLGNGLEWAAAQARRVIHDNDVERLTLDRGRRSSWSRSWARSRMAT